MNPETGQYEKLDALRAEAEESGRPIEDVYEERLGTREPVVVEAAEEQVAALSRAIASHRAAGVDLPADPEPEEALSPEEAEQAAKALRSLALAAQPKRTTDTVLQPGHWKIGVHRDSEYTSIVVEATDESERIYIPITHDGARALGEDLRGSGIAVPADALPRMAVPRSRRRR